ncbi:NADAR family protein [Phytomonospora sp. NPDC050363]|uniref:NADAR family protein n=1 Tax=Phytomonospora sp. NPDC050363 TaxID=3155642 RepID=UPI0033F2BC9C
MDLASAVAAEAAGQRLRFLHFWGHAPSPDGRVTASCLSQWWPAPFTVDGVGYATCEHYMMAGKARLFGDEEMERRILAAAHPRTAKTLGRKVRGFDQDRWEAERFEIVVAANVGKFGEHAELGGFLAGTKARVLVEASPRDRIWGIGLAADDPRADRPSQWRGPNLLGFALMAARDRLA